MVRGILATGAVLALLVPSVAQAGDPQIRSTPYSSLSPLAKNQKIALGAIGAWNKASKRYLAFVKARPKAKAATLARVNCIVYEQDLSNPQLANLPATFQKPLVAAFADYTLLNIYRQTPRKAGRFSARAIKEIFTSRAASLARLKPDKTGMRIIRGLKAQATRITEIRRQPGRDLCKNLADWRKGGWDETFLFEAIGPAYRGYKALLYGKTGKKIVLAANTLGSIPGVPDTDSLDFKLVWVAQRAFSDVNQP